jgi:lambda repressor-like predicted transcriptional regulator
MSTSKLTVSDAVLIAAFKRGVSTRQLSRSTGVSYQRIAQILLRNGLTAGQHRKVPHHGHVARVCPGCGSVEWVAPYELAEHTYCSLRCFNRTRHPQIPDAPILKAIELRDAGWTWKQITAELGWTYQSLARWIWKLLAERGELTEARVVALLHDRRDRRRHQPRWEWLRKRLG